MGTAHRPRIGRFVPLKSGHSGAIPEENLPAPVPDFAYIDVAQTTVLGQEFLKKWVYINCTTAATVSLPQAEAGGWIGLAAYGSAVATITNYTGTTMGTLSQYQYAMIPCIPDSSGALSWPQYLIKYTSAGGIITTDDSHVLTNGKGFVLKDNAGTPHYWRAIIDAAGAWSIADLGTSYDGTLDAPET